LDGIEAYVRNDYRTAIACWQAALRYQPSNAKAKNAIEQTQKKLARIRQLPKNTHPEVKLLKYENKAGDSPTKSSATETVAR
jgi:hypothetical protein